MGILELFRDSGIHILLLGGFGTLWVAGVFENRGFVNGGSQTAVRLWSGEQIPLPQFYLSFTSILPRFYLIFVLSTCKRGRVAQCVKI